MKLLDKRGKVGYNSRNELVSVEKYYRGNKCSCSETESYSYNTIGNPTIYRGNGMTWTRVNQLTAYAGNTYSYGADGVRISKNNKSYIYDGDKLLSEKWGTKEIRYIYGMDGIIGFEYEGNAYYYKKNLQGDVIEIVKYNRSTESSSVAARYVYDAYGNHKVILNINGIGTLNPIRYRGYYYDTETGLYYVANRYYDPELGRFISQDNISNIDPLSINGLNLYAYCYSNPIMYKPISMQHDKTNTSIDGVNVFLGVISPLELGNNSYSKGIWNLLKPIPAWIPKAKNLIDIGFSASLIARTGWYTLKYPGVADLMLLDGLTTIPGKHSNAVNVLGYVFVAFDTALDIYSNIQQGQSVGYTIASAAYTAVTGLGIMWAAGKIGAAIGTAIGGVPGFIIGGLVGLGIGYLLGCMSGAIKEWIF